MSYSFITFWFYRIFWLSQVMKKMGVFEGKALYFCGGGGGRLFYIPVGGCLLWKCNSVVMVLLKNAVLWVSFVQMGSCGLSGFKYKEEWEKNSSNSLKGEQIICSNTMAHLDEHKLLLFWRTTTSLYKPKLLKNLSVDIWRKKWA